MKFHPRFRESQSFGFLHRRLGRFHKGNTHPPLIPSTKFFHLDSLAYMLLISFQVRIPLVVSLANPTRQAPSAGVSIPSSSVGGSNGTILETRFTLLLVHQVKGWVHKRII